MSIMVIIGAMRTAADAADVKSVASLHPRFFVFHFRWIGSSRSTAVDTSDCFMVPGTTGFEETVERWEKNFVFVKAELRYRR